MFDDTGGYIGYTPRENHGIIAVCEGAGPHEARRGGFPIPSTSYLYGIV